ncbi:MAG: flagellar basal body protein [Anaeromyxobacter sp.]
MTEGIEAITMAALGKALDAAALRQQAAAANIANASVEGYVPVTVSFEGQLEDARSALGAQGYLDATSLEGVEARLVPVSTAGGVPAKVQLDLEVAGMAQNATQYQALLKAMSKHLAVLSAAVSDGKK